jgi:hypothetical protein
MRNLLRTLPRLSPMPPALWTLWIGLAGVAVTWLVSHIGWWWVTFLVGLALGVTIPLARRALLVALVVGALGWGLPLALLAVSAPVSGVAAAVASLVGLPAAGGAIIVILVTPLVGCILSVVGAWVGLSGKRLLPVGEMGMRVGARSVEIPARPSRSNAG